VFEKAEIANTVTGEKVTVLFNPTEYTINRDNNYAQTAIFGRSEPVTQFVAGNLRTLEMELFIDTHEAHVNSGHTVNQAGDDVRKLTSRVTALMDIDPTTHAPPTLLFTWASLSFRCVLARATQHFILFHEDGTPVRARLQVTFNKVASMDDESKAVKRETADYSKTHVVLRGERISDIAYAAYGDPAPWRAIALANDIDDPTDLVVGAALLLPQLPYSNPGLDFFEQAQAPQSPGAVVGVPA
jgi:Contractile injection system tube protein